MIKLSFIAPIVALLLILAGCGESTSTDNQSAEASSADVEKTADLVGNRGRVITSLDVPGYSYLEVENATGTTWLAGNPVKVAVGDIVSWDVSTVMTNFHSKSLNRTFAEVIFVGGINTGEVQTTGGLPASHPPTFSPPPAPAAAAASVPAGAVSATKGLVISAEIAAGYSYLEVKTADDKTIWLAAPQSQVKADDSVAWQGGSLMQNFTSSTLGKTFPEIYFVSAIGKLIFRQLMGLE